MKTRVGPSPEAESARASAVHGDAVGPIGPRRGHLAPSGILGNRAAARMLAARGASTGAARLTVGEADDAYEAEADRTARQVMTRIHKERDGDVRGAAAPPDARFTPVTTVALVSAPDQVSRAAPVGARGGAVEPATVQAITESRASGGPLPERVRTPMERAFGVSFGDVRVHADERSDRLGRSLGARAFTTGRDVFFRRGEFDPGSERGQETIAHELTHVLQQRRLPGSGAVQRRFGMEIETRIPVTLDDKKISDYPTIGIADGYHIDIDEVGDTSYLEFVTEAFDEHEDDLESAVEKLREPVERILLFMRGAADLCTKMTPQERDLTNVPDAAKALRGMYRQTRVSNDDGGDDKVLQGPIHYTVGVSLTNVKGILEDPLRRSMDPNDATDAAELKDYARLADSGEKLYSQLTTKTKGGAKAKKKDSEEKVAAAEFDDVGELKHYLGLVYMQFRAVSKALSSNEMVKNLLPILPRVPMSLIRASLTEANRDWLTTHARAIESAMLAMAGGASTDKSANQIRTLSNGAFLGIDYDPELVFGKMHVLEKAEPVGSPEETPTSGYAMEIREMKTSPADPELLKKSIELLLWSRRVHGTDADRENDELEEEAEQ